MKKQKTIITITIIIIIIIAIILSLNLFKEKEPETYEELGYQPITPTNIIGTWTAISEKFAFSDSTNTDLENYSITFNSDNTYSSLTYGISETGVYRFKDDRIYFYDSEEQVNLEGNFFQAYGWIKDDELVLIFPQFPKTVVYEKV